MTFYPSRVDASLDMTGIRDDVDACLMSFIDGKVRASEFDETMNDMVRVLRAFLSSGGKRIRPTLCVIGWHAAMGGTAPLPAAVVQVAASLEMFHAFALIHDDVMDCSDTRRGQPTVHQVFASMHREAHHHDCAVSDAIGEASAILLGDLALVWSGEMLHTAELDPACLVAILPLVDLMRAEVTCGQYRDVLASRHLSGDVEAAITTIRFKTAKYTFERPLHVGARLAGDVDGLRDALTGYAIPLGEAFQLRDDVLGVFGDPQRTGKSVLDDLREGKNTVLTALAVRCASPVQLRLLEDLHGKQDLDDAGADVVRSVIIATGARAIVEDMIEARHAQALDAIESFPFSSAIRTALRNVADAAVRRAA
jgi:geranylgeranyl diphosphate synthase, type I